MEGKENYQKKKKHSGGDHYFLIELVLGHSGTSGEFTLCKWCPNAGDNETCSPSSCPSGLFT